MKFIKKLFILSMLSLFLVIPSTGFAFPTPTSFDSLGWVNPNHNDSWDGISQGTARYSFDITTPINGINLLKLTFEADIFDITALSADDFTVINPIQSGLTNTAFDTTATSVTWAYTLLDTTVSDTNSPLIIDVDYTLLDANRYLKGSNIYAGDTEEWSWDEAQGKNNPWSQAYTLFVGYDPQSDTSRASDGGSTAPIPEPGTILLLGAGLAGVGFYTRRRKS